MSIVFTAGHWRMTWRTAGLVATASLTRSSTNRAFGKYRLASTRSDRISGSVTTAWRSTLRNVMVPGIWPRTATCGRDVR